MTDLLTEQAAIKARRQTTRDTSGQFIRPDKALEIRVAGERMKARLKAEVPAAEHAEGRYWVPGHWSTMPNTDRLSVEYAVEVLPLFDQLAAA